MSIEKRNAFYKGILAAKNGKVLADVPSSYNEDCFSMWIAGHNEETERVKTSHRESELLASMMA